MTTPPKTHDKRPGVGSFSMSDSSVASCPHDYYAAMRRESPVHCDPGTGFYWVSQYADVVRAAADVAALSSKSPVILKKSFRPRAQAMWDAAGMEAIDTLVTADPPDHDHYRAVGMSFFTPAKVAELTPQIEARVHALIDEFVDKDEVDFIESFASRLPGTIVCDEFGFPRSDQQKFKNWTDAIIGLITPGITEEQEIDLVERVIELFRYLESHLRRAAEEPRGRVIHALATMPRRDGTPFTMLERSWMAVVTFVGGNETTINMLAAGVRRLANNASLQSTLRKDPGLMGAFVEELLRYDSSVQALLRVANHEMQIRGTSIPAGANVVLCTASANRDESRWTDPDEFRLDRLDVRRHLAFGHGRHACIGMHLARREMQIAFTALLSRLDNIELAIPDSEVEQLPLPFHRGVARLPIRFTHRDANNSAL